MHAKIRKLTVCEELDVSNLEDGVQCQATSSVLQDLNSLLLLRGHVRNQASFDEATSWEGQQPSTLSDSLDLTKYGSKWDRSLPSCQ